MSIKQFAQAKAENRKISMMTCYDFSFAKVLNETKIDGILVGDSVAMVVHGYPSTLSATVEMMSMHIAAVAKGAPNKFIVGDMPFMSYRKSVSENVTNAETLMRAGAHALKLEGADGNLELIQHLVQSGVPIMGHLGLTPQSINTLGGYKVQAKEKAEQEKLQQDCLALQRSGCFSIVLECVPKSLAAQISKDLSIPTIGIGAGVQTDGQILVLQDALGMNIGFKPKFLRHYMSGFNHVKDALDKYHHDVVGHQFPSDEESYL